MILQVIEQDTEQVNIDNFANVFQYDDLAGVSTGVWQVYPMTIYNNNYTYIAGTENVANANPILFRYDSIDNTIVGVKVGVIDNFDPLFHQRPIPIVGLDGHVYVFQINGHGQSMKVWKSNTTDISDGFSLHHTTPNNTLGYINIQKFDNYILKIGTRKTTGAGSGGIYGHIVGKSNDVNYNSFTFIEVTDPSFSSTNYRHYMMMPREYGDNSWSYFGIMKRNDSGNQYFAQAYYKTQDYKNFYSIDESFSKDVINTSKITDVEVESNLTYFGSNTFDTTQIQASHGFVLNDEIYGSYYNNTSNKWKFYKINTIGVVTEYDDTIGLNSDFTDVNRAITQTYNGNNIVYSYLGKIYTCDLDFNNQKEAFDFEEPTGEVLGKTTVFPIINPQDIKSNYLLVGNLAGDKFAYYVINDKFFR